MIFAACLLLGVLCLCAGSFFGAYVVRYGRGESVAKGRSKCDHCGRALSWRDNIPLLSWLFLKRRCRYCQHRLSFFYPAIELTTGLAFSALFVLVTNSAWLAITPHLFLRYLLVMVIACSLIIIFFTDQLSGLVPDSAIVVGVIFAALLKLWDTGFGIWQFRASLLSPTNPLGTYLLKTDYFRSNVLAGWVLPFGYDIAGALGAAIFFLFLVAITKGRGMGLGDVKFAFLLGLIVGWPRVLVALFLEFVLGALYSVLLILLKKKHFGQTIHFGPFLVLSIPLALLWGDTLLRLYLGI